MIGVGEDGEMELKAEYRGKFSIWMRIIPIRQKKIC